MRKHDIVKITGLTEWGKGREEAFRLRGDSGEALAIVAAISKSGSVRICDTDTSNTAWGLENDYRLSSWLEPGDAILEVV